MTTTARHRTRVLILEDNRLLRRGIQALFEGRREFRLLAAPAARAAPVDAIRRLRPELLLLDAGLTGRSSLRLIRSIRRELPKAGIVVLDLSPAGMDVLGFIQAGASGFVMRDAPPSELFRTLSVVVSGGRVLPPLLSGSVFTEIVDHALRSGGKRVSDALRMTPREREVLGLISDGLTNRQISQRLAISPYTVKSHIHNLMEKLTLHTRLEVANYAFARGVVHRKV